MDIFACMDAVTRNAIHAQMYDASGVINVSLVNVLRSPGGDAGALVVRVDTNASLENVF